MKRCLLLAAMSLVCCDAWYSDQRGMDEQDPPPQQTMAGAPGTVLVQGRFAGRNAHAGEGAARLFRRDDGVVELRFDADFFVTDVAGARIVLSNRELFGTSIQQAQGDVDLGRLQKSSGAQAYVVPGGDRGQRHVSIFGATFGTEAAHAELRGVP